MMKMTYSEFLDLEDHELNKFVGKTLVFYHTGYNKPDPDGDPHHRILSFSDWVYNYNITKIYNSYQDYGIMIICSSIHYCPEEYEALCKSNDSFACYKDSLKQEYEEVEVIENTEAKERLKEIFDKWLDENLK